MAADQPVVANLMTVELQAVNMGHNWLKQRLAFDKRHVRRIAAVEMQNVEGAKKTRARAASTISRIGFGEARKGVVAYAHNSPWMALLK